MHSKKLGRAAAAAGLMALLLPSAAFASWWDGGYDGGYNSGYDGRRGDSTPPRDEEPGSDRAPDYETPGETPPPDDAPPPQGFTDSHRLLATRPGEVALRAALFEPEAGRIAHPGIRLRMAQ